MPRSRPGRPQHVDEFSSAANDSGCQQRPKHDLESLIYILIHLRNGRLPWTKRAGDISRRDVEKCGSLGSFKVRMNERTLCSNFPELKEFVKYVKQLAVDKMPNYDFMEELLKDGLSILGYDGDNPFEWDREQSMSKENRISEATITEPRSSTNSLMQISSLQALEQDLRIYF